MKHRHKMHERARGGGVPALSPEDPKPFAYNAKGSNVEKEAMERKRGGRTTGKAAEAEMEGMERKRGGGVHHEAEGEKEHKRGDRAERKEEHKGTMKHVSKPGRKLGGSVGSNRHPLSSAATFKRSPIGG